MNIDMREIKFRAFHTPTNVMLWFDPIWGNNGHGNGWVGMAPFGEEMTKVIHRDNLINVDPTDCEIMQFTGLYDKNGKEIYEGDIVKKEYGQAFVKKRLNENIGVVELSEYEVLTDSWGVTHTVTGWNMEFSDKSGRTAINSEYEVIGNIHENKDLLP